MRQEKLWKTAGSWTLVASGLLSAAAAVAQQPDGKALLVNRGAAAVGEPVSAGADRGGDYRGGVYRVIDDPHNGDRWLLLHNSTYPGGPGRLVLAEGRVRTGTRGSVETASSGQQAGAPGQPIQGQPMRAQQIAAQQIPEKPVEVIRPGDRLVVEEESAVVSARLEAIALAKAEAGAPLQARLVLGGKVVRVMALGPGRAALTAQQGNGSPAEVRP